MSTQVGRRSAKKRGRGGVTFPPHSLLEGSRDDSDRTTNGLNSEGIQCTTPTSEPSTNPDIAALRNACAGRRAAWADPQLQPGVSTTSADNGDHGRVTPPVGSSNNTGGDTEQRTQDNATNNFGSMPDNDRTILKRVGSQLGTIRPIQAPQERVGVDQGEISTNGISDCNDRVQVKSNVKNVPEPRIAGEVDTNGINDYGNDVQVKSFVHTHYEPSKFSELTNINMLNVDGVDGEGDKVQVKASVHEVTHDSPGLQVGQGLDPSKHTVEYKTFRGLDAVKVNDNNMKLKVIFDIVASTGQANYRAARIPLPSALNIPQWRSVLNGYHDYHIIEFLEYGWPIGIDRDAILQSHFTNHPSAIAHPHDVEHYVATELTHGALLGPFAGPPANTCHFSPLMTRIKKDSRFRRVIIDLSWPKGRSVNDGISKLHYVDGPMTISLPTTDDMERAVVQAGRGSFLYKTDLARGYRQLRVDPLDWPRLSFRVESMCFMDICPPFGLRSSAMAMQRVSQAIVHLHSRRGYVSRAYIDDFGGVEPKEVRATSALRTLQGIMDTLGMAQAQAKICPPAQAMTWLGIHFDTIEMSMAIPQAKLDEVMVCLQGWQNRVRATRKQMQSLLGLLNFVASVAPPTRLFTNRMLDALREAPNAGSTSLSDQFKQDVLFFVELLPIFNGRKIMGKSVVHYQQHVELDACLTGCGAVAGDEFYAAEFPSGVIEQGHTIAHLELLNVVVALKMWQRRWSGWSVQIFCDNLNTVFVLQTGKSRDKFIPPPPPPLPRQSIAPPLAPCPHSHHYFFLFCRFEATTEAGEYTSKAGVCSRY